MNQRIKEAVVGTNVYILDDDEVVIQGVRFLGGTLWSDFKLFGEANAEFARLDAQAAMNDYRLIRYGSDYRSLQPLDTQKMFTDTVSFLKKKLAEPFSGKTVVVTHHAPSLQSVHPIYKHDRLTPAFASDLESLMGTPITLWVHGHVHNSNDYVVNGTRVISNPRGYHPEGNSIPENPDFKADLVIEI